MLNRATKVLGHLVCFTFRRVCWSREQPKCGDSFFASTYWAIGCPYFWLNIILNAFMRLFLMT